jgi:outer membrane protein assembly factor BamB
MPRNPLPALALIICLALVPLLVGSADSHAQDAATPPASPVPETTSGGWTNYKGDAGRTGVADAGPTGQPVQLWRVQAGGSCSTAPIVQAGVVYAPCDDGVLYALDAATGAERWRFQGTALGEASAAGELVYVNDADVLRALDVATGQERWQAAAPGGTGAVVDGGLLVIGTGDGFLLGLDAVTGAERWRFQVSTQGVTNSPALGGGIAYVGGDAAGFVAIDGASGQLLWRGDTGEDQTATAVVAEGIAYIGGTGDQEGHLYAFDAQSGTLLWRHDQPLITPTVRDGVGYSGSTTGIVYAFDTATGAERWQAPIGGGVVNVAIANGVLYALSDGNNAVYALDAATGTQLWSFPVDTANSGRIAVSGGVAYVSTRAGGIYAIGGTGEGATPAASAAAEATTPAIGTPLPPASPSTSPAAEVTAEFVWESTGGPEPLGWAEFLAVDPRGNLWVAEGPPSRFQILSPEGEFLETWGAVGEGDGDGEFDFKVPEVDAYLGSVAFDAGGNLYVADSRNNRIQKFGPDRTFLLAWGGEGRGDGQFLAPRDIAVDDRGTVFVVDEVRNDVQAFDADGTFLFSFGGFGAEEGQLNLPWGMTIGPDGLVWVADYNNGRVQAFAPDGSFVKAIGNLVGPNDVAVDAEGRVYVVEQDAHRVRVFAPDGTPLASFGEEFGPGPGAFVALGGIAVDDRGGIYVSDFDLKRVQKFRLLPPLAPAGTGTPEP